MSIKKGKRKSLVGWTRKCKYEKDTQPWGKIICSFKSDEWEKISCIGYETCEDYEESEE
ncbi:MAG: hypothetical protein WC312_03935 [Candidatus Omnitrophota bacterium]|jgi:hypothetical protein